MNLVKAISYIQLNTDVEITKKEFAKIVGVTEQALQLYRKDNEKHIPDGWIEAVEKHFGIRLPCEQNSSTKIAHDFIDIYYWEGCAQFGEKLINPEISLVCKDMEIVLNKYKAYPENLRIIAMPSDKMKGAYRPIRYGDILIIDTSSTDISYSGIYFFIAQNDVFVNRIDKGIDGVIFRFDNELYSEKSYSFEELENADFKVIGRVIHVESEIL